VEIGYFSLVWKACYTPWPSAKFYACLGYHSACTSCIWYVSDIFQCVNIMHFKAIYLYLKDKVTLRKLNLHHCLWRLLLTCLTKTCNC